MADHLQLPQPIPLESRRAGTGFGERPNRNPGRHGKKLDEDLSRAITAMRPSRTIEGVDPAYVFKIRAVGPLAESALRGSDLQWLGDTKDWMYFVLAPGDDPTELRKNLSSYGAAGDQADEAPGRSFFDSIEEFLPYDREDRRGPGLPADGDPLGEAIAVDVILWPSASVQAARARVAEVRAVLDQSDASAVLTADERARFTVVRARVDRDTLDDLLDLAVVERIRLPPTPRLEPSTWRNVTIDELPTPRVQQVAPIGLIDDDVMEHPLLPADVLASRSAIPAAHAWLAPSDHGTMVAGLCAYGDVEDPLAGASDWLAYGPIHAVRVLEPDPQDQRRTRFPTDEPAYRVIESAIRQLHDTHGVRVFNLSITDDVAYSGPHVSVWSERLDELAHELDIVIVVAAGNQRPDDLPPQTDVHGAYPGYLLNDAARIAEPAVAANVVTVGSIAHADAPQTFDGTSRPGDRAIAKPRHPSPFTRTGPGTADAIKPDLVERGGNWVLDDTDRLRDPDYGVSIISLVRRDQRFFGVANGTSFAAPRVTRLAAAILHRYPDASANLIRALLGIASVPVNGPTSLDAKDLRRIAGHGQPLVARALDSQGPRVAMTYEGTISANTVVIHPVTIPEEFARGGSWRTITVALAYDPAVRRTRREYLAGRMSFDLVRNMSIEDIKATWIKQPDDKALRLDLPKDARRPKLEPGAQDSQDSTLQVRTLRRRRLDPDDGDTYYVVVRHTSSAWTEGGEQRYALVVALEDEERVDLDLYATLAARLPVRVRLRS
ncbi:MAG: S8 family peptidase [Solirubrobacteraceae bacterium]|nr:S8 family peptidase [Solirubrobacteraceae bacterium]